MTIFAIVIAIFDIFAILLILKEIINIRDFKYTFTCEHCGEKLQVLEKDTTCKKCHRRYKNINKHWDHYLTFRVSEINTKDTRGKFEYKKFILPFKIELAINTFCFIILSILLISIILEVLQ